MKYGYGIVDRNNKVYWEEGCVCEDKEPLESTCEALNDYDDPRAPYRVAELRVEDSLGASMIADERERQIEKESWTAEHDDNHDRNDLVYAAIAYAIHATGRSHLEKVWWPWVFGYKPKDPLSDLTRAGALIAAKIDQLLRMADTGT